MKNLLILLAIAIFFTGSLFAKPVDVATAKFVGQNFLRYKANSNKFTDVAHLQLVYTSASSSLHSFTSERETNYFYVFNVANGFVIVSADDCVQPILGYSDEKEFRTENMAHAVAKWLENYKQQIRDVIVGHIPATPEIIKAWAELKDGNGLSSDPSNSRVSVDPLVQTKWDQPAPYNALCPGGSVTGCVATAMAQIMKYWNHPQTGQGFHSFNHENYGTVSANFGSTSYQWSSMPNVVTNSNNAVATLMYHCGVSVDMAYTPEVSGAWVIENSPAPEACSEYAFKNYFGYDHSLQGIERKNYADSQWENILKGELDAQRPILYDGFGNGGGHAFVCDGYDNNDFFHYNWGWSGYYDGYFEISALNPGGTGTGGGTGGYNSGQEAIIGIKPPAGGPVSHTLQLYEGLYMSSTNVTYGSSFGISTNILNSGSADFSGDYAAAVFDHDFNFVEFLEIKSGWTLASGFVYTNDVVFSTAGLYSLLPGTYYGAVFFRQSGGDWTIVGNGDYVNLVEFDISYSNEIEIYSDITVTPGTTLERGKPASVNLNILNDGSFTFTGTYSVDLYDLNGNWIENIGEINESNGLPAGYLYLEPYLNFSTQSIVADPGTYLLALTHRWDGDEWELSGSSHFTNPIYINVKASTLVPDIYENNNTSAQAYNLSLTFTGSTALKNTVGSDCHTGSDYDFYKINLPAGYDYAVTARMHDEYNSGNGNTYTLDGQFSFSYDGANWSESFDDVLPGTIHVPNGGTLYFFATPYFLGQTGSYLLDLQIQRTATTSTADAVLAEHVNIFPNPATDVINIDMKGTGYICNQAQLVNVHGQVVSYNKIEGQSLFSIPLGSISTGVYVLRLKTDSGIITRNIMITQ